MPPRAADDDRDRAPSHHALGKAIVIGGAIVALAGLTVCVAAIRGAFGSELHGPYAHPSPKTAAPAAPKD